MARRNKVSAAQLPLAGFTAPATPEAPAETPVPSTPPEPKPPNVAANDQLERPTAPSRPKAKATAENIHHHVLENEQIVECFGTLSEALFKQKECKQLGTDSTSIESYAGKGPCRRKTTFDIGTAAVTQGSLSAREPDPSETADTREERNGN